MTHPVVPMPGLAVAVTETALATPHGGPVLRNTPLARRLRRTGAVAFGVGVLGALLSAGLLVAAGAAAGDAFFAFRSETLGAAIFYGVPVLLVACLVPLAFAGLHLRDVAGGGADPRRARGTLRLMRGLLLAAVLVSLLGTVFGMSSRAGAMRAFGAVNAACFVAAAVLAARVRDAFPDLADAATLAPIPPDVPPASAGDTDIPLAARAPIAPLAYAVERDDRARDFLRLFDLLAIFGCIAYGLQAPELLDDAHSRVSFLIDWPTYHTRSELVAVSFAVLYAVAAAGWTLWGASYVVFGPLLYRACLCLAAVAVVAAGLTAWLEATRVDELTRNLLIGLYPGVMLFCLTRRRVRAAFAHARRGEP